MADISDIQAAGAVKIVGSDGTGVEQTPVQSTVGGALHANLRDSAGSELASSQTTPALNTLAAHVRPLPYQPATFVAYSAGVAIGNAKHMISLMNGDGSGVVVRILSVKIINVQTAPVTGIVADFRALRMSSLTGGTAVVSGQCDTADVLSGSVTCATGGSVTGLNTVPLFRRLWSTDEWGAGGLDTEGLQNGFQNTLPVWHAVENAKPIVLRAGQGLTIQQLTNSTNGSFDLEIVYTVGVL